MIFLELILVDIGDKEKVVDEGTLETFLHKLIFGDLAVTVNIHCVPGDKG